MKKNRETKNDSTLAKLEKKKRLELRRGTRKHVRAPLYEVHLAGSVGFLGGVWAEGWGGAWDGGWGGVWGAGVGGVWGAGVVWGCVWRLVCAERCGKVEAA